MSRTCLICNEHSYVAYRARGLEPTSLPTTFTPVTYYQENLRAYTKQPTRQSKLLELQYLVQDNY